MKRLLAVLPAGERVRRYREMAAFALQRAAEARSARMRTEYLTLASSWQVMAIEIEHTSGLTATQPVSNDDDPSLLVSAADS
ncbi:MAG TPA: hypothetical protein VMU22_10950 [Rhizomicrobium sp.]|nr:hypothetical protein [Rhizomicrobium sp.]